MLTHASEARIILLHGVRGQPRSTPFYKGQINVRQPNTLSVGVLRFAGWGTT